MRSKVRTHRRLGRLATRQHGVVSREQLRELGYSDPAIGRAATGGRLYRIHRGVYAVGHKKLTRHGACLAGVLACGEGALLSHSSAAWLWGLASTYVTPVEVTVSKRCHGRASIHIHSALGLTEEDGAVQEGIPVTSVARTLLDLAGAVSNARLERAIESSEQRQLFDLRSVEAMLSRARGHPGAGVLRRALDLYREQPLTRSPLERRFLKLIGEAGLPIPSANVSVAGYEIDMYWERERFAVELDGFEHHGTRAAFERDRKRQEDLALAGIETIRLTARRLDQESNLIIERLKTLLARRRREP